MTTTPGQNNQDDVQRPTDDLPSSPQASTNDADLPRAADAAATEHEHWLTPAADEKALRTQLLVRTLRHQIARVVIERRTAEARRGTEEATLTPEEIERRTNILLGDGFLKEGQLDRALDAYAAAGAFEKLIVVGDDYLERGAVDEASMAYAAAAKLGAGEARLPLEAEGRGKPPSDWFINYHGKRFTSRTFDGVAGGKLAEAFTAWMVAITNSEIDPKGMGAGKEDPEVLVETRRKMIEENAPIVKQLSGFTAEQIRAELGARH
jgi:hypothetical protein